MRRVPLYLRVLAVGAMLALFSYLVVRTGITPILERFRLVGWGFVLLILLSGARQDIRAVTWQRCMCHEGHHPAFLQLFGLRLVGDALGDVTPAGRLLGETAKIWAGSSYMPLGSSAASVAIEDVIYGLASALFISGGMLLLTLTIVAPERFRVATASVAVFLLLTIAVFSFIIGKRKRWLRVLLD